MALVVLGQFAAQEVAGPDRPVDPGARVVDHAHLKFPRVVGGSSNEGAALLMLSVSDHTTATKGAPFSILTRDDDVDAHALRKRGWTVSAIARRLGHDRRTAC